jgi:deoxyribodipyrimidine photo-lyase
VLEAFPGLPHSDYRPRGDRWSRSLGALEAWKEGRTGYPVVDAGLRQLLAEGAGNWQWVAGTGNDTRPNRVFNPIRQAYRFDPDGDYVRRYVPELEPIEGRSVHEPWKLAPELRRRLRYPEPIVDSEEAAAEFRRRRRS